LGGLDKYEPRDGILRQTVSGGTAVIGYSVGQLECLYNTARRLRFDCENDWLIMLIGKSMRLPNLSRCAFSWLKQETFLVPIYIELELPCLRVNVSVDSTR
jgi:hypothetical protein